MPEPLRWDMPGLTWDAPGLTWDGFLPETPSPRQNRTPRKSTMKHQPYLPKDDLSVQALLNTFDNNLSSTLATKYGITADQRARLHAGTLGFDWFLAAQDVARHWSQSITTARERMFAASGAAGDAMPGLPTLPTVPTVTSGGSTLPITIDPGFFDFLGRLVGQIKGHDAYDPEDGALLGIIGAEVPPPDDQIIPQIRWKIGPSGRPLLSVKKATFQGYTVFAARGNAAIAEVGFSSARDYELTLPLPAAGTAEKWKVQVQYRLKNLPFGQRSAIVEIPVNGPTA